MPTNQASNFSADVSNYIADETLPLARRQLVAYQFGDPLELPEGNGTSYTATRFNRVPLPFAPLAEGVPPIGEVMTIGQVTGTCQQWGDKITLTDIAEMTIKHPVFKEAIKLIALQVAETLDRNTYNAFNAITQVNYVGSVGSRAALGSGSVLNTVEIGRIQSQLFNLGAPRFMGDEITDEKIDAEAGGAHASSDPRGQPHYVAIAHPFPLQDLAANSTIVTAWSYSDINRLYNSEFGELYGVRFCRSNMVPSWTYTTAPSGTAGTSGNLATNATYFLQITGSDVQNQYESIVSAVSGAISVTGPAGSISFTTPNIAGYTWNAYIGTSSSPTNLATSASGPTIGPMQGQAVQLPSNTTVVLTGFGLAQVPPALPPSGGYTVYPTYVFGRGAYGQVKLQDIQTSYLKSADKSDPLNQLRVVGWKCMYTTLIQNQQFLARLESTSAYGPTFG